MTACTPGSASAREVSIELDARVRVRAAQRLRVQHARQHDVVGVDRGAGRLGEAVDLAQRLAHEAEVVVCDPAPAPHGAPGPCWSRAPIQLPRPSARARLPNGSRVAAARAALRLLGLHALRFPGARSGLDADGSSDRELDRLEDLRVARAAAQIARQRLADLGARRACVAIQKRARRQHHPRLAETALQRAARVEGRLHRIGPAAARLDVQRHQALRWS